MLIYLGGRAKISKILLLKRWSNQINHKCLARAWIEQKLGRLEVLWPASMILKAWSSARTKTKFEVGMTLLLNRNQYLQEALHFLISLSTTRASKVITANFRSIERFLPTSLLLSLACVILAWRPVKPISCIQWWAKMRLDALRSSEDSRSSTFFGRFWFSAIQECTCLQFHQRRGQATPTKNSWKQGAFILICSLSS